MVFFAAHAMIIVSLALLTTKFIWIDSMTLKLLGNALSAVIMFQKLWSLEKMNLSLEKLFNLETPEEY